MTQILVCTVGGSDIPVVNAVQQNRPDFVFFICSGGEGPAASQGTIEGTVTNTRRITCKRCDKTFDQVTEVGPVAKKADLAADKYKIVSVNDPESLDQLTAACEQIESQVQERWPAAEVIANYTGGTKTMSVALVLHAVVATRGRWKLQVNAAGAGRRDLISIETGDIAVAQRAELLAMRRSQEEAEELERRHDYEAAAAVVQRAARSLGTRVLDQLGETPVRLKMLAAWDRLDYDQALRLAEGHAELKKQFGHPLRELRRTVQLLTGDDDWPPRGISGAALVEDLVANARRCAKRQRFDDAFGRLYRATELVAQIRLRSRWKIDTSGAQAIEGLDHEICTWLRAKADAEGIVRFGLVDGFELLVRLEDPLGQSYEKSEQ